ncbi:hypothetical protein O6H91_17G009200 [Diphasiastrum complanatum]|nr:hypothetical protein O6H91_17G009200 [Diphasiastrum complanatum]
MLSNWSDSPPLQPVAETPAPASAASIVPPAVGGVTNPPRASSYVPPHLRNPRPSASLVPEAAQDAFRIHDSPAPLNGSKNHGRPSVLGAPPRAKPVAAAGSRAWPLTGSSPGEAVRWDTVAAEPSGGSNGRNAVNGRRGNSGNNGRNAVNDRRGSSGSNGRNAVNDRGGNSGSNGQTAINDRRGTSYREPDPFVKDKASEAIFSQENSGINFDAYEDIPVETSGKDVPPPVNTFGEIDLGGPLNVNIQRCKYVKPTPVQKHAIPISLAGRDLMACAQTGSGKTAAFCFPIIAGLLHGPPRGQPFRGRQAFPSALILSPTRELSCQIHDEAKKFAHQTGIKVVVAYGGTPIHHQLRELERGVDILVATPGRLSDLLERARISLSMVKYLALDEADRMLDMGFEPQIRKIVEQMDMPPVGQRQTMFFSATFPKEIQRLAADFLYNYIFLAVGRVGSSTDLINQKVEYVNDADKRSVLMDLIHAQNCKNFHSQQPLTLVFVETKRGADALEDWLCRMGFPATTIHGDRTQT